MKTTALITGASAGIGAELARLFAADGHDLVLVARRREKLNALAAELAATHHVTAHVIAADLRETGAAERIVTELSSRGIVVDFLVNNAGFGTRGAFAESDLAREVELVQVNIVALIQLTRLLLPGMIARKSGRVLNLGSTAGFVPGPFMAVYYASKAFVNSFTEALAVELENTGVTATASCPGATATEFAHVSDTESAALFKSRVMGAKDVARNAYRAMHSRDVIAIAGFRNKMRIASLRLAPRSLVRKVAARLNMTSPAA